MQQQIIWSLFGLALVSGCGDHRDDHDDDVRDTRDTRDTGGGGDTSDPGDTVADTTPIEDLAVPPSPPDFFDYRSRPFLFGGEYYHKLDDARRVLFVRELAGAGDDPPTWRMARVDIETGEETLGAPIDLATNRLEMFPSAVPGMKWLFGEGGARLSTFDVEALTLGPSLPMEERHMWRNVIWTWDFSAAAIGYGDEPSSGGANRWNGIFVVDLPPDPRTFEPADTTVEDFPLVDVQNIHIRVTSGGRFLAVSDAPNIDSQCNFLCFSDPDPARARFSLFDLASEVPQDPVIRTSPGVFDVSFRVSTRGRWLFRDTAEGVIATDLADPDLPNRSLPCGSVGAMVLGADDRVICAGPQDATWQVSRLDPELAVELSAVVRTATSKVVVAPDGERVLCGDQVVDFGATPVAVADVPGLGADEVVDGDGAWVWIYEREQLARMRWDDLAIETLVPPGTAAQLRYAQIEAFADGAYGVVGFLEVDDGGTTATPDPDGTDLQVFEPDGTLRMTLTRRLPRAAPAR